VDNVLDGLGELITLVKEIKRDVTKAIERTNDTPEEADNVSLNNCINDVNSLLCDILEKLQ
jgi:hypothetical protein